MDNSKEVEEPTYYGILPGHVRYDNRLKPMEKIMYTEITCLSNKYGYCYAKNSYFAGLYEVSKETVSRWVSNLVKCGHVNRVVKYKDGSKEVENRYLTINPIPIDNLINGGNDLNINTSDDYKINDPIDKKVKDNTTSSNIIKDNKPVSKKPAKKSYYDFTNVALQEKEYIKLIDLYGEKKVKEGIEKLSNYKLAKGKKYKSDYGALNTWVWDAIGAVKKVQTDTKKYQYNDSEKGTGKKIDIMGSIKKGGK